MTKQVEKAIRHIKTRADGWAVREIESALEQKPRLEWREVYQKIAELIIEVDKVQKSIADIE